MKKIFTIQKKSQPIFIILFAALLFSSCNQSAKDLRIKRMDSAAVIGLARAIESQVKPELAEGLSLKLWGVDSLIISPIAIDIDDSGKLYYTTTGRQINSEFDIRAHQDWEIGSIQLQTIDDKRAFLHKTLSPENSDKNKWLKDMNKDSSHDWRDMLVEKEKVYRVEDINGDGLADKSQLVVDDFHDEVTDVAGGVLINGKDLYVGVAPDLWRMKDSNGDGIADEKTSISSGYGVHIGFGGHGMSGVEMGPDGRIYWQIGDIGFNGKDKTGKKWEYPNSGVIARANPDGSDFEIFAAGLRNSHEFAFDQYANLISEDNDGDHAGEKERLVYIVNGSDAGWRSNWQYGKYRDKDNNGYKVWMDEKMWMPRFEGQAAYITPCINNFESGPAGVVYNPGTALSPAYNNTFFVAKFVGNPAKSGVYSFKLNPHGASFELGENKMVVGGILPTGLDFGPDGALYIADWIDGWDATSFGRIWKMDDIKGSAMAERAQTKMLLAANITKYSLQQLKALLMNADMRVRLKAQFELVNHGADGASIFEKVLSENSNQFAKIHSIWGISQLARKDKKWGKLLFPLLQDRDTEIRAQAAKWIGDTRLVDAAKYLIPLLKDSSSRARFFAAEALGRIAYEPAIGSIIEMLNDNNDQDAYLRHAGSLALARIGKSTPLVALSKDKSRALRIAAVVALRRMGSSEIAIFLNDTDEFVVTETARAINDDLSIKEALPALGNILTLTKFTNEALIRRAINANLRVGNEQALQNLIDYFSKENNPEKMRSESIETISTWSKPSVLDRVDGRYRGVILRDSLALKNKVGASVIQLLKSKEVVVRASAIKAIGKLSIKEGATTLMEMLKKDTSAIVRVEALKAIASMQDARISEAIKMATTDKDKMVRVAGIGFLKKMNISQELMVFLLSEVIQTKTIEERQESLQTLGKLSIKNTRPVFESLLHQMETNQLPPDILLELSEAIDSSRATDLISRYKSASGKLSKDALTAAYAGALYGGDAEKGKRLFFKGEVTQCIKCHAYDDKGGNAGPRLNGVAKRLSRQLILESLINPSARLAPGYGVVNVTLKNGQSIGGILESENNKSIVLKAGNNQKQVIAKNEISKRENAASSMMEVKDYLTKKEIRDLVGFLSTLETD